VPHSFCSGVRHVPGATYSAEVESEKTGNQAWRLRGDPDDTESSGVGRRASTGLERAPAIDAGPMGAGATEETRPVTVRHRFGQL
jgi:hypothetical protein